MSKKSEKGKNENIQVFVRCRPLSAFEKKHNSFSIVEAIPDQKEVVVREKVTDRFSTKSFVFDKVFGPSCSQVEVHKSVAVPLIKEVLMGYNCTIFAYGQTGTGKTFTMEGERSNKHYTWEDDPLAGLIPRTLQQIFEELESQELEFRIRVSYLELYNEELFDLLGPNEEPPKLRIFEDSSRKGSVLIQGLEEVSLRSKNEIYNILDKGSVRRRKAFTLLNASSSRSHAIFSITAQIKENCPNGEELLKIGKLHLVDLAGSESIGRSGAVDKRAREAGNINQSLLTLGRVITALYERASHIPYRESKLTRLLQDSLGGRTKTSIVATISPAHCNVEETLNTLDYAFRAKNITNKPEVNEKLTKKALVKEYTEEIKRLRRDLETVQKKNGIFVDEENYAYMQEELSSKTSVIKKTLTEIESLKAQIEKINELFCTSKDDLQKAAIELTVQKQKNEKKSQKLKLKTEKLDHTHKVLKKLSYQNDEQKHLIYKHMETEETLSAQAKKLQETASETISDVQELHKKVERKRIIETQNDQRSNDFRTNMQYNLGQMEDSISVMWQQHSEFINTLQSNIGSGIELFHKQMDGLSHVMSTIVSSHTDLLENLSSQLNNQGKSEQRWAGEVIKTVAQNKETATSSHRTFLSEQFIPLMNIIQMLMQGQVAALQDCGKTLMSKIDQQEASVKFHLSEQKDLITNLWRNIELLSTEQRTGLEVCQQHVNRRVQFESELYKEREEQISIIQKAVSSLKQSLERHGNQVNQETPLLQKQLDDVAQLAQTTRSEIESGTKTLFAMTEEFEKVYTADAKELAVTSDENLCKVKGVIDDIKAKHDTLKTEIIEFGHQSEQLSEQNYRNLEALIRQHAETEIQDLQDNQYCMQELVSVARFGAEQHESVLEQHKLEFEAHVAAQKSALGNMKDTSSAWVQEFSSNIWRRDKEMEKFLIEELQSDEPTGQTPDKKEYIYSREMAQTSPHDRILQRLRAAVNPSDELPPVPDSPLLGANERSFKIPEDRIDHLQPVPTIKLSDDSFVDSKDNEENKENSHHTPSKSTITTSSSSASHPLRVNNA